MVKGMEFLNATEATKLIHPGNDGVLLHTISTEIYCALFIATIFAIAYAVYKKKQLSTKPQIRGKSNKNKASANGLYESTEKPNDLWAQGIQQSEFTTIILWTLHIKRNGDLVYNDFVIVANGTLQPLYDTNETNIAYRLKELKSYDNVQHVLFSIGSGSWYDDNGHIAISPDFYNLHQILFHGSQQEKDNLYNNFKVLIDLGIDGFDSDCEEWGFFSDLTHTQLEDTHIELFSTLYYKYPHLIFTFVPYRHRSNWINIATQLYALIGQQIVKFWNVQMYGARDSVKAWIDDIALYAEELGLAEDDVNHYIIPGYNNSEEYWSANTPHRIKEIFSALKYEQLPVNGGMIWNLSQTYERDETLFTYSEAIVQGLSTVNS